MIKEGEPGYLKQFALTEEEEVILKEALTRVQRMIAERSKSRGDTEVEQWMAGCSLQDWVCGVSCEGIEPEDLTF